MQFLNQNVSIFARMIFSLFDLSYCGLVFLSFVHTHTICKKHAFEAEIISNSKNVTISVCRFFCVRSILSTLLALIKDSTIHLLHLMHFKNATYKVLVGNLYYIEMCIDQIQNNQHNYISGVVNERTRQRE